MVITYLGGECFKITQGELTLAFNPPSKDSSLKASKFGADIALVSMDHEDFNGVENAAFGEREPFVISGPGEYEVKGVAVRGFASESSYGMEAGKAGGEKTINTIYSVSLEGMNLCFLGALGTNDLPTSAKAELDDIDILFLPIGDQGMLDYDKAYALAVQLEPKAVIPMHYTPSDLKNFLKEAGKEVAPQEKLTVKKKDLEGKEGEIIVLTA
ncbi:MAG TPA: MBL fold metallo-hydrolase [Candidatus Paceibacterota bacterium]|nr:MBL fold metallo-hydrolase [Candidatus Paceibacterota bacterium]